MSRSWKTPYGPRRVRHDPPTLDEAIAAASGLTDDLNGQVEIAASLMGMAPEAVRSEVLKAAAQSRLTSTVVLKSRAGIERSVVVERKTPRRPVVIKRPAR